MHMHELSQMLDTFAVETQLGLSHLGSLHGMNSIYTDTLLFPSYAVLVSASFLVIHAGLASKSIQERGRDTAPVQRRNLDIKQHAARVGGRTIFAYMLSRLVACLTLLGLCITSLVIRGNREAPVFERRVWLDLAMCTTLLYASLLALVSVKAGHRWSSIVIRHLNSILLVAFCVYVYRDVFPLATYTKHSQDQSEGWVLWAKVSILAIVALYIPLTIPRRYIPFDPENPSGVPNPEQTASLLSIMVLHFLDPVVYLAYRIPHLTIDHLPPLADYDMAKNLRVRAFRHLDVFAGATRRHLFFGLMRVFRVEYITMAFLVVLRVFSTFAAPVGIYKLLHYLETGGQDSDIRPWLWILWLFFGPVIGSLTYQVYIYISTHTVVAAEAIITQLVFEHALRMRLKAESTSDSVIKVAGGSSATPSTPENASVSENQTSDEDPRSNDDGTPDSSNINPRGSNQTTIGSQYTKEGAPALAKSPTDGSNLLGKINNLVTTDLGNITDSDTRNFLVIFLYVPLQVILCIFFLYAVLGWSAFVGLLVILTTLPVPGYVAKLVQNVQKKRLEKTDARVQAVTETLNVLRMIKLFGWEKKMNDRIAAKREEELDLIKKRQFLDLLNNTFNFVIPVLTMIATYATYVSDTVVMKQELNASIVFSSMTVFDMLRSQLSAVSRSVTNLIAGKVSLERIGAFLVKTELLDAFTEQDSIYTLSGQPQGPSEEIGFHRATFAWSNDSDGLSTPSTRKFLFRVEDELKFRRGGINLIIGPTGSGKTSLLMALLGEMHYIPNGPDSWYNLPREGGIAYAAQESWVHNETIRENIIFGSTFDEARYKTVIEQCGLERDISLFKAGDQTEVGEKGLTLSGGQKARITLARAVYSQAEIILLDDVLAALDVHTSKWIIENCLQGHLVKGRTVILATHNVAMAQPIADFVVSVKNGRVSSTGSVSHVTAKDPQISVDLKKDQQAVDQAYEKIDSNPPLKEPESTGKLIIAEEIEQGHVPWSALKLYFDGLGGTHVYLFFLAFLGGIVLSEGINTVQTWFLGHWASQYDNHPAADVNVFYYLGVYGCLLTLVVVLFCITSAVYVYGSLRASRSIHRELVKSVLGTTLRWLDTTPTSRVIARCTQDIRSVDGPVAQCFEALTKMSITMVIKFSAVVVVTPVFIGPGVLVFLLGAWLGQVYMSAQLSVKREMSNAKSPVLGHFGAAISGITSIRAYGTQQTFKNELARRIDRYSRAARTFYNLNRWVTIRMDAAGSLLAASLAAYLVYFQSNIAATTGFSLNMAVGFSSMILVYVRTLNEFEVQGNSLERVHRYIGIEQEAKPTPQGIPPAYWPASGDLVVEKLSARYSPDGADVLRDISFKIKSGERIGVVGRTGSGKSSLTLSLLRCIYTDGTVYYDGIPINTLNLDALRSNITIIPQMPELLSGSLRQNLDPFDQYDDATLNNALRAAGLFSLQSEMEEGRITLDSDIASAGGNLSVGQRQILALARAMVRGSKLLILDEDYKTDAIIQSSLRNQLSGDVTVITVAHRLQTIMDADKIMVLETGRIAEFGSPRDLLRNREGKLRALVDESVDKHTLHAMAEDALPRDSTTLD